MSITRIEIKNYRGIEALDIEPGPGGAVARGRCGSGKTSVLKAVRAALAAQDIGPDAIRTGAEKAEILVDLDSVSVRRAITQKTSTLSVSKDGFRAPKPQAYLSELLGTSPLDPMDLLTLKPKERRTKILEALPVTLTVEQLRRWWPECPDDYQTEGHGLEVLDRLRTKFYEKRTGVNKLAKDAVAEADRLFLIAAQIGACTPSVAPDAEGAKQAYEEAKTKLAALKTRRSEAEKVDARTKSTRDKAKALHDEGNRILLGLPAERSEAELAKRRQDVFDQQREVELLQEQLRQAEECLCNLRLGLKTAEQDNQIRVERIAKAMMLQGQASELEAAIQSAAIEPVSDEQLEQAESETSLALTAMVQADEMTRKVEKAKSAGDAYHAAREKADDAKSKADRLDKLVKTLTDVAPRELLASCAGIPGLTLEGDDVRLDGISLDGLCGAEQIRFAVQVAKRANAKTNLLIVDGLERLDPESYGQFVQEATSDGWQLLASRVDAGEIVIESIGLDCAEAAE